MSHRISPDRIEHERREHQSARLTFAVAGFVATHADHEAVGYVRRGWAAGLERVLLGPGIRFACTACGSTRRGTQRFTLNWRFASHAIDHAARHHPGVLERAGERIVRACAR